MLPMAPPISPPKRQRTPIRKRLSQPLHESRCNACGTHDNPRCHSLRVRPLVAVRSDPILPALTAQNVNSLRHVRPNRNPMEEVPSQCHASAIVKETPCHLLHWSIAVRPPLGLPGGAPGVPLAAAADKPSEAPGPAPNSNVPTEESRKAAIAQGDCDDRACKASQLLAHTPSKKYVGVAYTIA